MISVLADLTSGVAKEGKHDAHQPWHALVYELGIPPHKLRLKVGAVCIVAYSLSIDKGLVKNAYVIVEEMHKYSVVVKLFPFHTSTTATAIG
jgi:hypothetical protein